jgi:hypothetical protein
MSNFGCCFAKSEGLTNTMGLKIVLNQVDDDLGKMMFKECVACWGKKFSKKIANTFNCCNCGFKAIGTDNDFINLINNMNTKITRQ